MARRGEAFRRLASFDPRAGGDRANFQRGEEKAAERELRHDQPAENIGFQIGGGFLQIGFCRALRAVDFAQRL